MWKSRPKFRLPPDTDKGFTIEMFHGEKDEMMWKTTITLPSWSYTSPEEDKYNLTDIRTILGTPTEITDMQYHGDDLRVSWEYREDNFHIKPWHITLDMLKHDIETAILGATGFLQD